MPLAPFSLPVTMPSAKVPTNQHRRNYRKADDDTEIADHDKKDLNCAGGSSGGDMDRDGLVPFPTKPWAFLMVGLFTIVVGLLVAIIVILFQIKLNNNTVLDTKHSATNSHDTVSPTMAPSFTSVTSSPTSFPVMDSPTSATSSTSSSSSSSPEDEDDQVLENAMMLVLQQLYRQYGIQRDESTFPFVMPPPPEKTESSSSLSSLKKKMSPQTQAFSWLKSQLKPDDKKYLLDTTTSTTSGTTQDTAISNNNNDVERRMLCYRYVLAVFYYSTTNSLLNPFWSSADTDQSNNNNDDWFVEWQLSLDDSATTNSSSIWLSNVTSVCDWYGIVCSSTPTTNANTNTTTNTTVNTTMTAEDFATVQEQQQQEDEGFITGIFLSGLNLTGTIPLELSMLGDSLQELDLSWNRLYLNGNQINALSKLSNLNQLILSHNDIIANNNGLPLGMEQLTKLQELQFSFNKLSGTLELDPDTIAPLTRLSQLTHLEMEYNYFTGTFPNVILQLSNLKYLYLRHNKLVVDDLNVLVEKATFSNLVALWLDNNHVVGTLPPELPLKFPNLQSLSLAKTSLSGTIPMELGQLTDLRRLWMYSDLLTGTIPLELSSLTNLEVLELHDNDLVGEMPTELCAIITMNANFNQFDNDETQASLTSDCLSSQEVVCTCCTTCY